MIRWRMMESVIMQRHSRNLCIMHRSSLFCVLLATLPCVLKRLARVCSPLSLARYDCADGAQCSNASAPRSAMHIIKKSSTTLALVLHMVEKPLLRCEPVASCMRRTESIGVYTLNDSETTSSSHRARYYSTSHLCMTASRLQVHHR